MHAAAALTGSEADEKQAEIIITLREIVLIGAGAPRAEALFDDVFSEWARIESCGFAFVVKPASAKLGVRRMKAP